MLNAKRFRCLNPECQRQIFCERITSVPAHSRRTAQLQHRLSEIAYQIGGQAGARLATLLGMPVSDTKLIRILRANETPICAIPKVLGVDDWPATRWSLKEAEPMVLFS